MNMLIPLLIALVSVGIFIYMKKKQADRHDERVDRLRQKQDELMELLQKSATENEKKEDDEN